MKTPRSCRRQDSMSQLDDQFDLDIRITPLGRLAHRRRRALSLERTGGSVIPLTRVAATPVGAARSRPATSSWRTAGSRSPSPGTTAKTRATAAARPGRRTGPDATDGRTGRLRCDPRRLAGPDHCRRHRTAVELTCSRGCGRGGAADRQPQLHQLARRRAVGRVCRAGRAGRLPGCR